MINIIDKDFLKDKAKRIGFDLTKEELEKFYLYADFLLEYNKKVNLTAIVEPKEVVIKHFLDSMILLKYINVLNNQKLLDVGTGAGFPGVVLKILKPDLEVFLLDSLNKRIVFLNELIEKLSLKNIYTYHDRVENFTKNNREKFDFITNRAFSNMPFIMEACVPSLKVSGILCPLRGKVLSEEEKEIDRICKILKCDLQSINNYNLFDYGERNIITIKKISQTSLKYPRLYSNMTKNPI